MKYSSYSCDDKIIKSSFIKKYHHSKNDDVHFFDEHKNMNDEYFHHLYFYSDDL
jgi:hypothetical protein